MQAEATHILLVDELDEFERTSQFARSDLEALRAVADWIKTFVVQPHKDLGRAGPVCPFVPEALERKALWLIPERSADRSPVDVVELIIGYQKLFFDARPDQGDDTVHKAFFVVFTDLSADRANEFFDDLLERLAVPSYVNDGFAMGAFYEGNKATAIYNPSFRPFTSPVPSLLMRRTVVSDWKFFLDDDDSLKNWAHRFGESGARELAEELRGLPWRSRSD